MASEELVSRLRERATTLWQWAGRAERTTGPSATTEQWRIDGDLHDDAATEIARLARELEETRAALRIAQTTAANLHDTIRLRDRELEAALERERRLREALMAELYRETADGGSVAPVTELDAAAVERLWRALIATYGDARAGQTHDRQRRPA